MSGYSNLKRFISKFLVVLMVMSTLISWGGINVSGSFASEQSPEMQTVLKWKNEGFIKGDEHGNLNPNRDITRAEFMAIVNKVFGYMKKSGKVDKYVDVKKGDWYYDIVATALEAGYVTGVSSDKMAPNKIITNQEAMVILASLTGGYDKNNVIGIEHLKDANKIPDWSKAAIAKCIRDGYASGYNGYIHADKNITRAQSIYMLDHKLTDSRVFGLAGTYDLKGKAVENIEIHAKDVSLCIWWWRAFYYL